MCMTFSISKDSLIIRRICAVERLLIPPLNVGNGQPDKWHPCPLWGHHRFFGSGRHRWGWSDAQAGMQPSLTGDLFFALSAALPGFPSFCPEHRQAKEGSGGKGLDAELLENRREHTRASSWGRKADFREGCFLLSGQTLCHSGKWGFWLNSFSFQSSCPSFIWRLNKD